jgi:hypothetical protein
MNAVFYGDGTSDWDDSRNGIGSDIFKFGKK